MKKITFALFAAFLSLAGLAVTPAHARDSIRIGIGGCCGYGGGYYAPYYYGGYYPPYYYEAPPTVVYAAPPQVTYVQPQPQQVIVQQPQTTPQPQYQQPAPPPAPKKGSSQTFTDEQGRTCRTFETTVNGDPVGGKACLQPDGTWRTVNED